MTQNNFISAFRNSSFPLRGIDMNGSGVTVAKITRNVSVTHDYKKDDRIEVIFTNDQKHFRIITDDQFKSFIQIYSSIYRNYNSSLEQRLEMWCSTHLTEC